MEQIALLCPTGWDRLQLKRLGDYGRLPPIHTYGQNAERAPHAFDVDRFVTTAVRHFASRPIAGLFSSSDYSGSLVAAIVAHQLGLPGPRLDSVLACSSKYHSRLAQQECVPNATPRFALIDPHRLDPRRPGLNFPMFVKPVKSTFSRFARHIPNPEALQRYLADPDLQFHLTHYSRPFNQVLGQRGLVPIGNQLLAEEVLTGHQVTLEGFVNGSKVSTLGVVDSAMYGRTLSFRRFDCPTRLPHHVQERMGDIAARFMRHINFCDGLFNIEFMYDADQDKIMIVEVNPRMCAQFADLRQSVDGVNTYETAAAVATATTPPTPKQPPETYPVAASLVLRRFQDSIVRRAPSRAQIDALAAGEPPTLIASFYRSGQSLSSQPYQHDGHSHRYATINTAAASHADLQRRFQRIKRGMNFQFVHSPDSGRV